MKCVCVELYTILHTCRYFTAPLSQDSLLLSPYSHTHPFPCSIPKPWQPLFCSPFLLSCYVTMLLYNRDLKVYLLLKLTFTLGIISSRFIQVVLICTINNSLFLFIAECYSMIWMYDNVFNHSLITINSH